MKMAFRDRYRTSEVKTSREAVYCANHKRSAPAIPTTLHYFLQQRGLCAAQLVLAIVLIQLHIPFWNPFFL